MKVRYTRLDGHTSAAYLDHGRVAQLWYETGIDKYSGEPVTVVWNGDYWIQVPPEGSSS